MHWIAAGIETNVAYGTCMLLFGLLVLSVRHRKMANRSAHMIYAIPMRGAVRPTPRNKSAQISRRATTPDHPSRLLLSTGLEYTPCERANSKPPKSCPNRLAVPRNFPLTHK